MNTQTNINEDSFDEEDSLQNELQEVKKLSSYRKGKKSSNQSNSTIQYTFAMISGTIIALTGFAILIINQCTANITAVFFVSLIIFAIGVIVFLGGLLFAIRARKKNEKPKKTEIIIVSKDQFIYNKEIEKSNNIVTLNAKTILNSAVKEKKFVSPLADLEDEAEATSENKIKVVKNYDFFDMTSEKVYKRFDAACRNSHVYIPKKNAIDFLSHLLYSRMLLLRNVNKFCRRNLSTAVEKTFQSRSFYIDCSHMINEDQLICQANFDYAFAAAKKKKDDFVFLFLDGVNSSQIYSLLKDFLFAIFDKNNPHKVRTPYGDRQYEMLPNLYFIILLKEPQDTGLYANKDILTYAPILKMTCSTYNGQMEQLKDQAISISDFHHIADGLMEDNALEESTWKKIDELQKFINKIKPYEIGNDIINFIEEEAAFSSSLYHDDDAVLDSVFATDILPSVVTYLPKERVLGEDSLENFISDQLYSEFSLPKTEALLTDYNYTLTHSLTTEAEAAPMQPGTETSVPMDEVPAPTFFEDVPADSQTEVEIPPMENQNVDVSETGAFSQKNVDEETMQQEDRV